MYLFFDTETNGLPKNMNAKVTELDNWPRVIQLAWSYCKDQDEVIELNSKLVKPNGWTVPKEKFWIENGYSTEKLEKQGFPLEEVIEMFLEPLNECKYLIAHNMQFDLNVLGAEFIRLGIKSKNKPIKICTKEASTEFCAIPNRNGYPGFKWPNLTELHNKLFNKGFSGAHDAGNDVRALEMCFFELKRLQVIRL